VHPLAMKQPVFVWHLDVLERHIGHRHILNVDNDQRAVARVDVVDHAGTIASTSVLEPTRLFGRWDLCIIICQHAGSWRKTRDQ